MSTPAWSSEVPDDELLRDQLIRAIKDRQRSRQQVLSAAENWIVDGWPNSPRSGVRIALQRVLDDLSADGLVAEFAVMQMSTAGLEFAGMRFAGSHLGHLFEQLLVSTVFWACERGWNEERYRSGSTKIHGVFVIAEYAAFTHQRALYELFCDSKDPRAADGRQSLGLSMAIESPMYEAWWPALNSAVAHLASRPLAAVPHHEGKHLHDQVGVLSSDLVRLWDEATRTTTYETVRSAMTDRRRVALEAADRVRAELVADLGGRVDVPRIDWTAVDPFEDRRWRTWS